MGEAFSATLAQREGSTAPHAGGSGGASRPVRTKARFFRDSASRSHSRKIGRLSGSFAALSGLSSELVLVTVPGKSFGQIHGEVGAAQHRTDARATRHRVCLTCFVG